MKTKRGTKSRVKTCPYCGGKTLRAGVCSLCYYNNKLKGNLTDPLFKDIL